MKITPGHKELLEFHRYLWQECPDVRHGPKSLYCCLLTYEHKTKNTCWPCQETLSRLLCCDIKSVKSWTEYLELKDMIRCERYSVGKELHIKYELFHPRHRNRSEISLPKSKRSAKRGKHVQFPTQNCTNWTPLTILRDGSTG